jgi:CheY-like chemotaxis protein
MLIIPARLPHALSANFSHSPIPEAGDAEMSPSPAMRKPTVLVVDDEGLIADSIVEILNENGYEASAAYGGHAAVNLASSLRPDLLLTDVLMPRLDGIETAMRVAKTSEKTRILLFSGQAGAADLLRKATTAGLKFELLPKPIHPQHLLRTVSGMLQN